MHHTVIIIGRTKVRYNVAWIFDEIWFTSGQHVIPIDCNVVVSIMRTLHMIKAKSCAQYHLNKLNLF